MFAEGQMRAAIFFGAGVAALTVLCAGSASADHHLKTATQYRDSATAALQIGAQARAVLATDPSKAAALGQSLEDLSAKDVEHPRDRRIALATAKWIKGDAALRLNQSALAKSLLAEAYDTVVREERGATLEADILTSRASLESIGAEVQSALSDYLKAFQIYKKAGDKYHEAAVLQDIGLLYNNAGDYERALSYYGDSTTTFSGKPALDLSLANNRAVSLAALGRYGAAAASYQQALNIAVKLNSTALEAQVLNNLAFAQMSNGKYKIAGRNIDEGMRKAHGPQAGAALAILAVTAAELDFREGKFGAAKSLIETALVDHGQTLNPGPDGELHLTAYRIFKALGENRRSLEQLEAYQRLENDHRDLMASANSALMSARFDFDNQKARIALLTQGQLRRDIALSRLRARQSEIIAISLASLITVLIVFFVVYLRTLQRSRDRLHAANLALNATNVKLEQALQAKTQFLATTSHEIRTPLNGILGMTEVILADQQASVWVRQRVSLIHTAGEAMRGLVDDLLDMSKMDAAEIVLQREIVDLPTLLGDVHQFWLTPAESAGLTLTLDVRRAPVMIVEDGRRLRQILSNLLSNAVKFTPSGTIAMSAETVDVPGGEQVLIRVVDSGIGIPPESRDLVFEKFTQLDAGVERKYAGTGLGLSIARSLARAMGGDIVLTAGATGGAAFTVTLPLERVLSDKGFEKDGAASSPTLEGLHVVIVEPNPIRQAGLRAALERRVDTVAFQPTIKDAVEVLRGGGVHVVIASIPKGDRTAETPEARELAMLATAAQLSGVRFVVIVDEGMTVADAGLSAYSVSVLERPVGASRLLGHLEGLCELGQPLPSLRA